MKVENIGILLNCVVCGKRMLIVDKSLWAWKVGHKYCCSYTCREKLKRSLKRKNEDSNT